MPTKISAPKIAIMIFGNPNSSMKVPAIANLKQRRDPKMFSGGRSRIHVPHAGQRVQIRIGEVETAFRAFVRWSAIGLDYSIQPGHTIDQGNGLRRL